ncbi:YfcE family phosphodiesterase [Patescibacteria group bacterium]|nr:YfcE family phosphodiesterase [Patescibacteria group bacterium]
MKIAILADSHDNVPNIEKTLSWINNQNISLIIHCGDLCAPSILTKVLIPNFKGEMHLIHGNVGDPDLLEKLAQDFPKVTVHGQTGELTLNNKKIAFNHFPKQAKELAQTQKYDYVFYGHNHKPWEQTIGKTKLVNPGTLAGMFYKATFAILDLEKNKLELKILERM